LTPKRGKWCCWCCSCQRYLPIEVFRSNPNNRSGVDSWCWPCHARAVRAWRAKNGPEYNAKRRREYREKHPLPTRYCAVCDRPMMRPANVVVCGEECRRERKRAAAATSSEGQRRAKHCLWLHRRVASLTTRAYDLPDG
jgi:hypothetical protein